MKNRNKKRKKSRKRQRIQSSRSKKDVRKKKKKSSPKVDRTSEGVQSKSKLIFVSKLFKCFMLPTIYIYLTKRHVLYTMSTLITLSAMSFFSFSSHLSVKAPGLCAVCYTSYNTSLFPQVSKQIIALI